MSEKWYFTEEQLANSPSRRSGINAEMELSYRQRAANLIQEMGQRLQVSQLCINTAIVYMHRFYAFHSFTMFHRNSIAAAAFFLAAKVEEQPRKLEHVIKILNICLEKTDSRDSYAEQAQELVFNENILLQTLGFDVAIDHPHTHVVKACQLFNIVTVSRELRQTCYFMASNSLHLTTMCLKYRPTVVAAFCIYIACKWSRWEIPDSSEGKAWYSYVDESVTIDTLKKLTEEYLQILERSPSKFKSKMKAITSNGQTGMSQTPNFSGESATRHNNQHHHHHHHHRNNSASSSSASGANVSNSNGNTRNPSSSSSSSKAQMHQMSSSQAYKQQVPSQQQPIPVVSTASSSSSSHNMHRPRPSSSSSSTSSSTQQQQQQMYSSNSQQKPDDRQRMMHQDGSYYSSSSTQRMSDHNKHRTSSSSSQQQQQVQQQHLPQTPYMKQPNVNDQKQHSALMNSAKQQQQNPAYPIDMHQKSMSRSSTGNNSSSGNSTSQMSTSHVSQSQKKPPWMQSQQQQQVPGHYQNQDKMQQYPHLQKNLQMSNAMLDQSASNMMNVSKSNISSSSSSAYNDIKSQHVQQQQQQTSNTSQNDFWFNEKVSEPPTKTSTPPRQAKSLFSPSPEQDSSEKAKYMMMTGNLKRENVDSPKEDRKTSTPSKRDKSMHGSHKVNSTLPPPSLHSSSASSMQKDRNFSKNDNSSTNLDTHLNSSTSSNANTLFDQSSIKKRSYSSVKDSDSNNYNRDAKLRKIDNVKLEPVSNVLPPHPSPQAANLRIQQQSQQPPQLSQFNALDQTLIKQQPIETNPDIVKSLLKECFSTSSKFDSYDTDSPLDVINPELPDELLEPSTTHQITQQSQQLQQQVKREPQESQMDSSSKRSDDRMDSSAGESRKDHKKKSKKKKEKHKHKKKHKSSDREDRGDSLKLTFAKEKRDSKSSPESNHASFNTLGGGLKIKIPMKDVGKVPEPSNQQPAPIKLKISKEKFSSFANLKKNNNNSTAMSSSSSSSSTHKKKDKDRDKTKSSKSSKHSSSDFKESVSTDR